MVEQTFECYAVQRIERKVDAVLPPVIINLRVPTPSSAISSSAVRLYSVAMYRVLESADSEQQGVGLPSILHATSLLRLDASCNDGAVGLYLFKLVQCFADHVLCDSSGVSLRLQRRV
jgi:hypothetical protein